MLSNDEARAGAQDIARIVEDELDEARVLVGGIGQPLSRIRGLHIRQACDPALSLGNHLVGDDHDVTVFQGEAGPLQPLQDDDHEIIASLDHRDVGHGSDGNLVQHQRPSSRPVIRMPAALAR